MVRYFAPTQVAGKKGDQEQAIGRSRGGRTTKIHAIVDDEGRPHALLLTGGNVADITGATQLLAATEPSAELIADKAYDADHLRAFLQARGTLVVIPNKSNRVNRYPFDADKYKARNVIEIDQAWRLSRISGVTVGLCKRRRPAVPWRRRRSDSLQCDDRPRIGLYQFSAANAGLHHAAA